ncbi:MAG: GntR family transcriptional regulator [Thermoplasmata archaeon]|nr:GntR family transcriptional regulator [Thermoplasmata archaeon]
MFRQLYRQLVRALLAGEVSPGTILPSARQLASDLGVHYHTVNKTYGLLRRDGFAVLNRRKQLRARLPRSPAAPYLGDWAERQEKLLHEALDSGVRPEEIMRRLATLLRRAGVPWRPGQTGGK